MIKQTINKLTEKFNNKKIIEYLILIAILGIVIVFMANGLWGDNNNKTQETRYITKQEVVKTQVDDPNYGLEQKIAQILSHIQGVGRVSVLISYEAGPESIYARDIKQNQTDTDEKDSGGGIRKIIQEEQENNMVFIEKQSGIKEPVVLKQLTSTIKGIIVVADGADNAVVKSDIIRAVEAVTSVEIDRIQVFKRR